MTADPIGLYVHIPFCLKKCAYCDFCSFADLDARTRALYIERLCEEIEGYRDRDISIDSIFFGGGTPSLLTADEISKIVRAIKKSFLIMPDTEFTLEANPKTLTAQALQAYIDAGVNRVSIGLQSIHENELKKLGRIHTFADFLESYRLCRDMGINNINVDLMYGIPEQTLESFKETLLRVCEISPEHLSVYGLILEEGTPLHKMAAEMSLPTEENECDMYYLATEILSKVGYSHYEISNYAKNNMTARHNLKYWRGCEYIGVGISAYSYLDRVRYGNTKDMSLYLSSNMLDLRSSEQLEIRDVAFEYAMLRLRLAEGFSLSDYRERFGMNFLDSRKQIIEKMVKAGYVIIKDGRISFTEKGFYVSNGILAEIL